MTRALPWLLALTTLMPNLHPQDDVRALHVTPAKVPVRVLDATAAFEGLTEKEKQYAHWMSTASWMGALICFEQVSAESPAILDLLLRIYDMNPVDLRREATRRGVTAQELEWLDTWAACFLSNTGNYLSFGDTKFVPRISPEKVGVVVGVAAMRTGERDERLLDLWERTRRKIWSLDPDERELGLGEKGVSAYYGEDVSLDVIQRLQKAMEASGMEAWNTRVFLEEGRPLLRVASVQEREESLEIPSDDAWASCPVRYGDFSWILAEVNRALEMAHLYAANDTQRKMVLQYIEHFEKGDIGLHKDAMRSWVADKGPAVETNLGFIETYRDPLHVRAEWEGLVAIVDREQSAKFGRLVDRAETFIARLPWPSAFEKDGFQRPDFTSLEVLAFANGGIPAGINIPNYDDIRLTLGFKNVSLGNVLRSRDDDEERVQFVPEAHQALYKKVSAPAFEVQVGLHELLGHGSGKLLMETAPGTFNFDRKTRNPLTGEPVATWYEPGQTWGSQFGKIAASYEECRAEAVGLYLCLDPEILRIFGHEGEAAEDIVFINWLAMARAGLAALPYYNPETDNWGQAHMQARYALLRTMMEAEGLVTIRQEGDDWVVDLDRKRIGTGGKEAIGGLLGRLNIHKATADAGAGSALYAGLSAVEGRMLEIRADAIRKRKPRHIWVQPVTDLDASGKVILRTYPGTYRGLIDSFLDRYAFLRR